LEVLRAKGVNIIYVELKPPKIKNRQWLFDKGNEDLINPTMNHYAVVPGDDGWYTVHQNESVIFVDKKSSMYLLVLLFKIFIFNKQWRLNLWS
jgi:hypothetical protein